MPIDYRKYPDNWFTEIRPAIMARATGSDGIARCEQCGVPNRVEILRNQDDKSQYLIVVDSVDDGLYYISPDGDAYYPTNYMPDGYDPYDRHTRVVLTIHHIGVAYPDGTPGDPRNKMDNRPENLIALCQRCHLLADLPHHISERRRTMLNRKHIMAREVGQLPLWGTDHDR